MSPDKSSARSKEPLSADVLARGSAYAMEQAWHLLRDAVLLIQQERYASSLVLATHCLEQLGRAEVYRKNAKLASEGKHVTLGSMGRALTDHMTKLYEAQIPVTAALATAGEPPAPGSPEERQLMHRLQAVRKLLEHSAPKKAMEDRKRALHVDRVHYAPRWNRPRKEIARGDAAYYVGAADVRYSSLRNELLGDETEVGKKIGARIEFLQLPEPPWDVLTWE